MRSSLSLLYLSFGLFVANDSIAQEVKAKPFAYKVGKHGKGELKYVNGIPVLILEGTPEEMGEQMGELAVKQVKPLFNFPLDYFKGEATNEILRTNPTWKKDEFRFKAALTGAELIWWPALQKKATGLEPNFPAAYRKEIKAIAEAAGKEIVTEEKLVSSNGMFDLGHIPQSELARGCSSFIIPPQQSATKGVLFGRNLDFYHFNYLYKYSLLVVYKSNDPKKHSFASAAFPGFVGSFTGMNDAGLTIASHEVQDPDTPNVFNSKGVPFAMAYRRVLEECATIGDAVKLLDSMERASVTSLVIADTTGGAVIEVTPDAIAVRRFKDKPGYCTNHFCTMKNPKLKPQFDTEKRFDVLKKASEEKKEGGFTVDDVKKGMHDARLLDGNKDDMTIQTFVFEPSERKVHLRFSEANEPATKGKLSTLELKKLWGK